MRKVTIGLAIALMAASACGNAEPRDDLVPALERLAASNNAEAIYHLGMAYQTGAGVPSDAEKALEAFRRASKLGDVLASYKLGCFYNGQEGDLVERDSDLALRYKLVAAEAGYALAQQDVAALFAERGEIGEALAWLEKAALQGWPEALMTYASIHNGAPGVAPNPARTAAYFRLFLERAEANEEQSRWLEEFEARLSREEELEAAEIVRSYRAVPTPLTLRALSGQRAAFDLVRADR